MLVELNLHIYFCVFLNWLFGMELHIACFADGESNRGELHDSEIALWHGHQNVSPFFARLTRVPLTKVSSCRTILTAWDGSRFCGRALLPLPSPSPVPRLELHARISFGRGLQSRCGGVPFTLRPDSESSLIAGRLIVMRIAPNMNKGSYS